MKTSSPKRVARALAPYIVLWGMIAGTLVAAAAYQIASSRAREVAAANQELSNASHLLRAHTARTLEGYERTLTLLKAVYRRRSRNDSLPEVLAALQVQTDAERRISIFDRSGAFVVGTDAGLKPGSLSIADRSYFVNARNEVGSSLRIGAPIVGRLTGRPTLPLYKRLQKANGEFDGLLLAALDPQRLMEFYRGVKLGQNATLGLIDGQGFIYARSRPGSASPNVGKIDDAMILPVAGTTEEVTVDRVQIGGVPTMIALSPVPGSQIAVFAAVGEDDVLASYREYARNTLALLAIALIAVSLPVGFMAKRAVGESQRRRRLEQQYEGERHRARTDPLTAIANRIAFNDHLHASYAALTSDRRPFTLGFIDIDRFKALNDARGHAEGDRALKRVAKTLVEGLRQADLVARLGGDEFAVVMPGADENAARQVFEKLRTSLLADALSQDFPISFSIGVVAFEDNPSAPREAVNFADRTMYEVKANGRDGIRYAVYRNGVLHQSHSLRDTFLL